MHVGGKRLVLFPLMILFLTLAGCWDSNDIETRANVLALAIDDVKDKAEAEEYKISHDEDAPKTEMIRVTAQIAIPGEVPLGPPMGDEGESEPVWVLSVVGHSLGDAISNLQQEVADQLFLGQLRVIVINEDVAKKGVDRFNESLRRNPEIRRNAWMVVSQEEAAQYMDMAPELEDVPTLYLANVVDNAISLGKFPEDYMGLFWRMISSKGQDGFLPYLRIKGPEEIQVNGLAYFKGDQMMGHTDPVDIGTFMGLIDYTQGGYEFFASIPGTDADVFIDTESRDTKMKTEIKEGKPRVNVSIRYELVITEKAGRNAIDDSQIIKDIEERAKKDNNEAAKRFINEMQAEKSDIFGFGEYIRAKHPGYWNQAIGTKEKWQEVFQDIDVNVDVSSNIRRVDTGAR
ncbi:Ger(x)C family spore germination protein [Salicibibacter cibarius]|uniref:Ger(X)C family spore germination protein n=1 Tax=Salicibibacter cibarius TaxID=2743000 RepID=A0A7T6Z712_9BACI|nr:Ger(x)C family spore germination protein [Salicibibacter cibarius]QQK77961.1 Ger(x)C family spore germination protein [Salicibibacter cibarius]